jgi:hypothetical protein
MRRQACSPGNSVSRAEVTSKNSAGWCGHRLERAHAGIYGLQGGKPHRDDTSIAIPRLPLATATPQEAVVLARAHNQVFANNTGRLGHTAAGRHPAPFIIYPNPLADKRRRLGRFATTRANLHPSVSTVCPNTDHSPMPLLHYSAPPLGRTLHINLKTSARSGQRHISIC